MKSNRELFKEALAARPCPASGTGCHTWLFWAACTAVENNLGDEVIAVIGDAMSRPPSPPSEIEDALCSARREEREPAQKWPPRNMQLVQKVLSEVEWSLEPTNAGAAQAVPLLFPGNPLVCIGKSSSDFVTRHVDDFKFLDRYSLIVPSPMSAEQGKTKAGHMSAHSLENTGPRHCLITEWDWSNEAGQLKLIRHLSQFGLLVAIVHSGGKSVHAWWDFRGQPENKVKRFMDYAVTLGADPRLWLRSQFVRLPGGTRDDGRAQKILLLEEDFLRKESNI